MIIARYRRRRDEVRLVPLLIARIPSSSSTRLVTPICREVALYSFFQPRNNRLEGEAFVRKRHGGARLPIHARRGGGEVVTRSLAPRLDPGFMELRQSDDRGV